jgi:TatD DNase family protein
MGNETDHESNLSSELVGRPSLKLIDTHAHLDEIKDIREALARAKEAGIRAVVGVGADLAANEKILELAGQYPNFVFPALGLHPWRLNKDNLQANFSLIERELPRCVALGEVGLDFAIETPQQQQEEVLRRLLAIASREKKPVLLHARRAWARALDLLQAFQVERAVFHWYSGPEGVLKEIFERGYFISATPAAAYSERHRRAIKMAPLGRLLLETDAPENYQGNPSEPKDLFISLKAVSELKGQEPTKIADQTFLNAQDFFKLSLP